MTRILSEILQAPEPFFQMKLRQLEQVSGHKNTDIKLSVEVTHAVKQKIKSLGLDQQDTTSQELYQAVLARVGADDVRLERSLRTLAATHISAEADLMAGTLYVLQQDASKVRSFSLKVATLRRLLKKTAPKRVLKQLGYRSLDAMLRNEAPQSLLAAALSIESAAWRKSWLDSYKQLKPADFEEKVAIIIAPSSDRWQEMTSRMIAAHASTAIGLPEAGTVVLLPLPVQHPSGMVIANVATALQELNSVAAISSYLQASQVQADFASRVRSAASGSVTLDTPLLQRSISWQLVQQYFAKVQGTLNEDVFGPYVQAADFYWHNVEARLADICPSMEFWQDTHYLSFLHDKHSVSLNILDAAINRCNTLAYEARATTHAQEALWHELTLRYLNREALEQAIMSVLRPQLAHEMVSNE